jgi:hypothetical protein
MNVSVWSNDSQTNTAGSSSIINSLLLGLVFLEENPSYYPYFIFSIIAFLFGMIGIK